jgi:hypothetical protein
VETFIFFTIANAGAFRHRLFYLVPHITTSQSVINKLKEIDEFRRENIRVPKEVRQSHYIKLEQINIGLSAKGLNKLGINPDVGDDFFKNGQVVDAVAGLGDPVAQPGSSIPDWEPEFKRDIHGVIIVASECTL